MAFPAYESTTPTASVGATTSHTINMPATVNSGDLLIAVNATFPDTAINEISGWTKILGDLDTAVAGVMAILVRVADGTEGGGSYDFTTTSNSRMVGHIIRVSSWYGSLPGVEVGGVSGATNAAPNAGEMTPSWGSADQLWIWFVAAGDDDATISAAPTGYSNLVSTPSGGGTNAGCEVGTATKTSTATSDNPDAGTISETEGYQTGVIAIRPAAAGGTILPQMVHYYG